MLAHSPEVNDAERESWGEEPDFGQWLHLKLEMPKEYGAILHIEIVRPEEWVETQLGYVVTEAEESSRLN